MKARLDTLSGDDPAARIALLVREAEFGMSDRRTRGPHRNERARDHRRRGESARRRPRAPRPGTSTAPGCNPRANASSTVREFHQKNPLLPGIAARNCAERRPAFVLDALLADSKEVVADAEIVRSRSHKLVLKEDEEQARAKIDLAFE